MEIFKDTSNRIITKCKCRSMAPKTADMINCMARCGFYKSRSGGWCLYYEAGANMCTHLEEKEDEEEDKTLPHLVGIFKT